MNGTFIFSAAFTLLFYAPGVCVCVLGKWWGVIIIHIVCVCVWGLFAVCVARRGVRLVSEAFAILRTSCWVVPPPPSSTSSLLKKKKSTHKQTQTDTNMHTHTSSKQPPPQPPSSLSQLQLLIFNVQAAACLSVCVCVSVCERQTKGVCACIHVCRRILCVCEAREIGVKYSHWGCLSCSPSSTGLWSAVGSREGAGLTAARALVRLSHTNGGRSARPEQDHDQSSS